MDLVGRSEYAAYEQAHVSRIGPVVAPMMLLELGSGIALLISAEDPFRSNAFFVAMGLLIVIWLSTFLIQVPLHGTLSDGFDDPAHTALVSSNWIRTLAWTARGGLLLWVAAASWPGEVP